MSQEFFELFDALVPSQGQAVTEQGELIRAIGGMAEDFASNGSANWDNGYELLSLFALEKLLDGTIGPKSTEGIKADIEHIRSYGRGEDIKGYDIESAFARLMTAAVFWCKKHPDLISRTPNPALKR